MDNHGHEHQRQRAEQDGLEKDRVAGEKERHPKQVWAILGEPLEEQKRERDDEKSAGILAHDQRRIVEERKGQQIEQRRRKPHAPAAKLRADRVDEQARQDLGAELNQSKHADRAEREGASGGADE